PGPDPSLHIGPRPGLEHHRVDAVGGEEMRQQQAGRPGADDRDPRPHARSKPAAGPGQEGPGGGDAPPAGVTAGTGGPEGHSVRAVPSEPSSEPSAPPEPL